MEIVTLTSGPVSTNTYILFKEEQCLIIDPSCNLDRNVDHILNVIQDVPCVGIWLTHGHYDHMIGVDPLVDILQCPVFISDIDAPLLSDPEKNASKGNPIQITVASPMTLFSSGILKTGPFEATVISTPGHTSGCVTFVFDETDAFVGDFIFRGSIGRTDLFSGSMDEMMDSLTTFKHTMPHNLTLYPGHGPITTLALECEDNPYLQ